MSEICINKFYVFYDERSFRPLFNNVNRGYQVFQIKTCGA